MIKRKPPVYKTPVEFPIARFDIAAYDSNLFFDILIFRNLREMRKYANTKAWEANGEYVPDAYFGIFFEAMEPRGHRTKIGEICFSATYLRKSIVGHELNHAAIRWAVIMGIDPLDGSEEGAIEGESQEEVFVTLQGEMVETFYEKAEKFECCPQGAVD